MTNVSVKKSAEEMHVELSDGRRMSLEDLVRDYERLLKEEVSKKAIESKPKDGETITKELKVGEWFRIDRNVIDENRDEIYRKCIEVGIDGERLWKRFESSNEIASLSPRRYTRLIETYIFDHNWFWTTVPQMGDMCKAVGDGMCDEVICDLELQMRICNGESVYDLIYKSDKLPRVRIIKLRNRMTGYFGGSADLGINTPPTSLYNGGLNLNDRHTNLKNYKDVPYAFRRVLQQR